MRVDPRSLRGRTWRSRGVRAFLAIVQAPALVFLSCAACAPEGAPAEAPSNAPRSAASSSVPATPASPTPAASGAPTSPDDVVAGGRAAFDACYAQARSLDPKLGRVKVEMTFAIDADGKPTHVDFKYNRVLADRAKDCMRDAALGLSFPASMQGTQSATTTLAPAAP